MNGSGSQPSIWGIMASEYYRRASEDAINGLQIVVRETTGLAFVALCNQGIDGKSKQRGQQ